MSAALRISVVMPSYNQGRFIRQAIDSVLAQSYRPLDLLVMDGGSTDTTLDVLRSYGDRIAFVSERDRGQSDALNRGLARVQGDVLCWLNSDDTFLPGAIARVMQTFEDNPDADFVYGKGWNVDEQGRLLDDSGVLPFNLWKLIHQRNFIHQPSCFFRRSLLAKAGPIDEGLHYVMDWDLWIRFGAFTGMYLDDFLSCNRTYALNKTQSGAFRRWRELRRMVGSYSNHPLPPVLPLYFLEALLQWLCSRPRLNRLAVPLRRAFAAGMAREASGVHADGSLSSPFYLSVPNLPNRDTVRLLLSPLSRYDRTVLGSPPLTFTWRGSSGQRGQFVLHETGRPQEVQLLLAESAARFTHLCCRTGAAGQFLGASPGLPPRRVVAFLDRLAVAGPSTAPSSWLWPSSAIPA